MALRGRTRAELREAPRRSRAFRISARCGRMSPCERCASHGRRGAGISCIRTRGVRAPQPLIIRISWKWRNGSRDFAALLEGIMPGFDDKSGSRTAGRSRTAGSDDRRTGTDRRMSTRESRRRPPHADERRPPSARRRSPQRAAWQRSRRRCRTVISTMPRRGGGGDAREHAATGSGVKVGARSKRERGGRPGCNTRIQLRLTMCAERVALTRPCGRPLRFTRVSSPTRRSDAAVRIVRSSCGVRGDSRHLANLSD